MRRFVLDVETNGVGGFRPPRQRVMQLAYGAWSPDAPLALADVASVYVRGAGRVAPAARGVHGLSPEFCETRGVSLGEAVSSLCAAMGSCDELVGHNLEFDVGCLLHQLAADGFAREHDEFLRLTRRLRWRCTMREGTALCRLPRGSRGFRGGAGFKFPRLGELYEHLFGAPPDVRLHDAAADCFVTAACVDAMPGCSRPVV